MMHCHCCCVLTAVQCVHPCVHLVSHLMYRNYSMVTQPGMTQIFFASHTRKGGQIVQKNACPAILKMGRGHTYQQWKELLHQDALMAALSRKKHPGVEHGVKELQIKIVLMPKTLDICPRMLMMNKWSQKTKLK